VLNRGNDKRRIFLDDKDRRRFVRNLHEMNDVNPVFNTGRHDDLHDLGGRVREPLVQIHAWCLMDNHFHLLLSEVVDGGTSKFLMKLNVGFVKYFNERHQRVGTLFQGKTKRVLIESERHYLYILLYIHCNPLDNTRSTADWRRGKLTGVNAALEKLREYRWSSLRDYAGRATEFEKIVSGSELYADKISHMKELVRFLKNAEISSPASASLTLE
jgi:putative transposase